MADINDVVAKLQRTTSCLKDKKYGTWVDEIKDVKAYGFVGDRSKDPYNMHGSTNETEEAQTEINDVVSDSVEKAEDKEHGQLFRPQITEEDIAEQERIEEEDHALGTPIREYLGKSYTKEIHKFRAATNQLPEETIKKFSYDIKQHQLNAASRLVWLGQGILADDPGMGKTLVAAAIMRRFIDVEMEAGTKGLPWIYVTRANIISSTKSELHDYLEPKHRLNVTVLTSKTTVEDLYQYDVVLTSYQHVTTQYRRLQNFKSSFQQFRPYRLKKIPTRPLCCLFSELHEYNSSEFPGMILDEVHYIKNHESHSNEAILALPVKRAYGLSGTILPNQWYDSYGIMRILKNHPFTDEDIFMKTFGSSVSKKDEKNRQKTIVVDPTPLKVNRLVKFLLGKVIRRDPDLLRLPHIMISDIEFELNEPCLAESNHHFQRYIECQKGKERGRDNGSRSKAALAALIRAQQASIHPKLHEARANAGRTIHYVPGIYDDEVEEDEQDDVDDDFNNVETRSDEGSDDDEKIKARKDSGASKDTWLENIKKTPVSTQAQRMAQLQDVIRNIYKDFPGERMMITSEQTATLDIVAVMLEQMGFVVIRYDGRLSKSQRDANLKRFQESDPGQAIMLITPSCGGTGINIPQASLLLQTELWWNTNIEHQMYARCHRPGQVKKTKVFRMVAINSHIDLFKKKTQTSKQIKNNKILEGITMNDGEKRRIPAAFTRWDDDD